MAINYKRLVALSEQRGAAGVEQAFQEKAVRTTDVDLGKLFVECFGWPTFVACRNRETLVNEVMSAALLEAEGAVSTAAFLNITQQWVYQTVLDSYQSEDFVFTKLIPERPASSLDGEKIAGLTEVGDELAVRNEGDPYALAGFGENWVFTPGIQDRGMAIPITWEVLFNDKTGQASDRGKNVGKWAGVNQEKAAIDCVIDENTTRHRYNWRGTVIASYGNNSGTHSWDNLEASNALVDWTDLNNAEQLFNNLVDPFTGEPIVMGDARHLLVTWGMQPTADYVLKSTQVNLSIGGYATSGNLTQYQGENRWKNKYQVVSSRLLASRLATDTDWFLGDVGAYARCMVAEPMRVVQAPANNEAEFWRRIVQLYRVNYRKQYAVVEPRAMVRNTA